MILTPAIVGVFYLAVMMEGRKKTLQISLEGFDCALDQRPSQVMSLVFSTSKSD